MSSYVEAWVRGWVHSRNTAPPKSSTAARKLDIRHAVLCATTDGRYLYERLGWTVRNPMVGAHHLAPEAQIE